MDIDLVAINGTGSNAQTLKLMEIAENLGLPVEAINQAGEYFLKKIDDYQQHLILFSDSKKCRIYRPDAYLFLKLKLARATETDLSDCMTYLRHNKEEAKQLKKDLLRIIRAAVRSATPEKQVKILELDKLLNYLT